MRLPCIAVKIAVASAGRVAYDSAKHLFEEKDFADAIAMYAHAQATGLDSAVCDSVSGHAEHPITLICPRSAVISMVRC